MNDFCSTSICQTIKEVCKIIQIYTQHKLRVTKKKHTKQQVRRERRETTAATTMTAAAAAATKASKYLDRKI